MLANLPKAHQLNDHAHVSNQHFVDSRLPGCNKGRAAVRHRSCNMRKMTPVNETESLDRKLGWPDLFPFNVPVHGGNSFAQCIDSSDDQHDQLLIVRPKCSVNDGEDHVPCTREHIGFGRPTKGVNGDCQCCPFLVVWCRKHYKFIGYGCARESVAEQRPVLVVLNQGTKCTRVTLLGGMHKGTMHGASSKITRQIKRAVPT